ncbi:MAG: shikimate kinase, partial [Bacteroidia bacterium]
AKFLAQHLNYKYIDSDEEVSKQENLSISKLFETKGQNYFREIETKWINEFNEDNSVVAVGGGLPIFSNNMELLLKKGKVFWIDETFEVVFERIKEDKSRPLLTKTKKELEKLYQERLAVYSKAIKVSSPKSIEDFLNNL